MGCIHSIPQISGTDQIAFSEPNNQNSSAVYQDLSDTGYICSARSAGSPRSCCSFGLLIEQNENYQIYEYLFQSQIGKGSTTKVYQVKNVETDEVFAAKVYSKSLLTKQILLSGNLAIDNIKEEIEIQSRLHSPYIMAIIEIIEDEPSDSIIMVLPIASYGNLVHFIKEMKPSEEIIQLCFHQIAKAIEYIHSQNVTHRDIKPANILVIDEDAFCLADFSCAKKLESKDELLLDTKGTPAYLSPEECSGDMFPPQSADIWAYGLSLYWAIFGCLPFDLDTVTGSELANLVFTVSKLLQTQELVIPECSPSLRDLLTLILNKNHAKRPTIQEIIAHPYFNQCS